MFPPKQASFVFSVTLFTFLTLPFLPNSFARTHRPEVQLVYFFPSDRKPQSALKVKLRRIIRDVQKFYADEMERHGYGRKTFQIETHATGQILVHQMKGKFKSRDYLRGADVYEEISEQFDGTKNIIFALIETGDKKTNYGGCGVGGLWPSPREIRFSSDENAYTGNPHFLAMAWVHTICLNLELVGHELGHAFGLDHDWRSNNYIMSYGPGKNQLSKCAAEWLDVHRAFNPAKRVINTPLRAKRHPPRFESPPNTIRLDFTVTDLDGIHQVQLLGSTKLKFGYNGLIACKGVNGKSSRTVEFRFHASAKTSRIELRVIDVRGNFDRSIHHINIKKLLPTWVHIDASQRPPMYWVDAEAGTLHRLTGDEVENIVPNVQNATSLAVDTPRGKLYWTEKTSERTGKIKQANLDGSNVKLVKDLTSVPLDIVLDTVAGKLYLINSWDKVQRLNVNGSNFQTNLITGLESPKHITLDVADDHIYWTEKTGDKTGKIQRAPLNGANVELVKELKSVPHGIAIDSVNRKLYLTNSFGKVQKLNVDGSNYKPNFITNLDAPQGVSVDTAGRKIYWIEQNSIRRADLNGENIEDVVTSVGAPTGIILGRRPAAAPAGAAIVEFSPETTLILANYPNPFNPETWIPYELATDTDVKITIYNTQGVVVRTLSLGHQTAGYYTDRDRAAYWDGRNRVGEPVASGIYFYQLTTPSFQQTRRLVIVK